MLPRYILALFLLAGAFEGNNAASVPHLAIRCDDDSMTVTLKTDNLTELDLDKLSLIDINCDERKNNGTHVIVNVPFDSCMTKHNTTAKTIVYYNSLLFETKDSAQNPQISRDFKAEYPFQCTYSRTKILSVVSFSPKEKIIYTRSGEFGNFSYLMDIYETDQYVNPYNSYPISLDLADKMYLQVEVRSNDSQLALFLERCWATPSSDPYDSKDYTFIQDGCTEDDTMVYDYSESPVQRFSIDAFRFLQEQSEVVHLHCMVEACRIGSNSSKCAQGCNQAPSRKRRAMELDAAEGQVMSVGPLMVGTAKRTQSAAAAGSSSLTIVAAVAGVLALFVLALFVALIVVYKKRQTPAAHVVYSKAGSDDSNHLV